MRNHIVHDYEGIKLARVWDVLTDDLPRLIADIEKIVEEN